MESHHARCLKAMETQVKWKLRKFWNWTVWNNLMMGQKNHHIGLRATHLYSPGAVSYQ